MPRDPVPREPPRANPASRWQPRPIPLAVGSAAPPQRPPRRPRGAPEAEDLPNYPGGIFFGIKDRLDIEGAKVLGRYFTAKWQLRCAGEDPDHPLPHFFSEGGEADQRRAIGGKGKGKSGTVGDERTRRVAAVMGLVIKHEGEYRRWHSAWGPPGTSSRSSEDEDWQPVVVADQPAKNALTVAPAVGGQVGGGLADDDPLLKHHQLIMCPSTSAYGSDLESAREMASSMLASGSSIVRRARAVAGQPLAYEARNVFIINLPEAFLSHLEKSTAALVYKQWSQCEIIIGMRPRRDTPPKLSLNA